MFRQNEQIILIIRNMYDNACKIAKIMPQKCTKERKKK